jgi:hypothetical protein
MTKKICGGTWAALVLVLCITIGLAGCSTDWIGEAEQIVAAMIPAAANLLTLVVALEGKTVSATDLEIIQKAGTEAGADLQLIQSLIAAYGKADAATKPSILNQIENATRAGQGSLAGLGPALHIKDAATQAKITAVVGILLSEMQSLAAVMPLVKGNSPALAAMNAAEVRRKAPLPAGEFVSSFNATMSARTGNSDIDRVTGGLRVRKHGVVARVASMGIAR